MATAITASSARTAGDHSEADVPDANHADKLAQMDPKVLGMLWIADAHDICVGWKDEHIEQHYADKMGISVSKLDVRTGRGEGDSEPPQIIIPVDRGLMQQTIDAAKSARRIPPIPDPDRNKDWPVDIMGPRANPEVENSWDREDEAVRTEGSLLDYCPTPFGAWKCTGGPLSRGMYSGGVFAPCRSPWYARTTIFPLDKTVPHTVVSVISDEPFRADAEGGLLRSGELGVGLAMIRYQMKQPDLLRCRYIPVTVLSFVWRHVRAVQIWHDRDSPTRIYVRVSRRYNFTEGESGSKWDSWLDLLCLMLGTPVPPPLVEKA